MSSFLSSIFGSKPTVPDLAKLDLGTEQQRAIQNNQAALPGAEKLVSQANSFSIDQINKMLESAMPGFSGISKTISGNIASEAKGLIPKDVSDAVQNSSAARSMGSGFGGSGMGRDLVARDLGITSLDLTQRAISSAESWMKTAASIYEPSMLNLSSMFVSPSQQASFDNEQNIQQFQRQWMQNQIKAMPDPVMRGIHDTIMSLADAYLGGTYTEGMKPGDYGKTSGGVGSGGGGGLGNTSDPAQYNQDEAAYFDSGGGAPDAASSDGFGGGFGGA